MIRSVQLDLRVGICMIQRLKNRQKGVKRNEYVENPVTIFCVDNILALVKQCILYQDIVLNKYII